MAIEFDRVEFECNPEPRCPCVLLLDTSSSMSDSPIGELNSGLQVFQNSLHGDSLAMLRVEVAVITFGPVSLVQDFVGAGHFNAPFLKASGFTPMGGAINFALDKIEERKLLYKQNGISYYRPWIFLVTDGAPNDDWRLAAQRIHEAEQLKKIAFFAVGVSGADMNVLGKMSMRQPVRLQGLNFKDMFAWLSSSLISVSRSRVGDEVPLQTPIGWGTV